MLESIKQGRETFKKGLMNGQNVLELQRGWAIVIDSVIKNLFSGEGIAILGLGGYGREEMSPCSDIDLLFLCEDESGLEAHKKAIDAILYPLWDAGFEAGGATRTLDDCSALLSGDVKAQTAMLEGRFITGNKDLADRFFSLIESRLSSKRWRSNFSTHKYAEYKQRIKRFGSSVYMLEPNVKEGRGGLRDYHTVRWLQSAILGKKGSLPDELKQEVEFLSKVRAVLHFMAGKKDDRLTFEGQRLVAQFLNVSQDELMMEYYRSVSEIAVKGRPVICSAAPFVQRLIGRWKEDRVKRVIGSAPSWQRLCANRDVLPRALFMLHETKELKEMFESFSNIYFRAQSGAYHVYTVDVHSIYTVKRMVDLPKRSGMPELKKAYAEVKRKDILLLSALLHDIGKGIRSQTSHTSTGAETARKEAQNCGYSEEDAKLVEWLVRSHLIMPRIAFSRDIADPHLIRNFADSVENLERLGMLYILAYADISSIGPDVWTEWKYNLLTELYLRTKRVLKGEHVGYVEKRVQRLRKRGEATRDADLLEWLVQMPEKYFIATSTEEIEKDAEIYKAFKIARELSSRLLIQNNIMDGFSEIKIMAVDEPGLFAKIACVMSACNVNILNAELNTATNGTVFDVLTVCNEAGKHVSQTAFARIESLIREVIEGRKRPEDLPMRRSAIARKKGKDVVPKVEIDNDVSVLYTVVDVFAEDRIGLLFELCNALYHEGCSIDLAKILTKAETAIDSFYVRDFDGRKIESREKIEKIKSAIRGVICGNS